MDKNNNINTKNNNNNLSKNKEYDIFGIENPIMDVIMQADTKELSAQNLRIGACNFLNDIELKRIEDAFSTKDKKLIPGGAVTNSLVLFSQLNGKAFFCGKVGNDKFGEIYKKSLDNIGLYNHFGKSNLATGRALTFITPDLNRTFALYLGAATTLSKEDIDVNALKNSRFMLISGYILEDVNLRKAAVYALDIAKENNVKIAIDVADPALILRCKNDLLKILEKYADIIFANEEESNALTGIKDPYKALDKISQICNIAIVKLGKKGSIIKEKNSSKIININCLKANAVDTTGAGDAYAGAFLFALSKDKDLKYAGELGAYCSAKVVECIGARLETIPKISEFESE